MPTVPATQKEWRVSQGQNSLDTLKFIEQAPLPKLGPKDVLVKFHAASLNYRDVSIPMGLYPFTTTPNIVPGSDGAGEVVTVGSQVTRFKLGDKVTTLFNQGHIAGPVVPEVLANGLGGFLDGTLRQYGAFDQEGLVHLPQNLNWEEASTLSCAALTAWNGLYGLEGRSLKPGDWVVTQGTGGVSMFAVQFAKSAGARVIATTSSNEKAEKLKSLGVDHIINYKETPNWGEKAKELTGGRGADVVIEVGGQATLAQSIKSVRIDGIISTIGFLGDQAEEQPGLFNLCIIRGFVVGSRMQFEEMNRAIEANNIHPIIDKQSFSLSQTKEAYQYLLEGKHFGKVVVKID